MCDNQDLDDDNDGILDAIDCEPLNADLWEINEDGICVGGGYAQDELTLSGNGGPEKFNAVYDVVKSPFYVTGSGYSRTIQAGGDYYSYWNEDNNYLIAWDSVNGYWMAYHLNGDDTWYDTEQVINALDDSDYDILDGKSFAWVTSEDYTSLGVMSQWEPYPGTSYKIPLEVDEVHYTGSEHDDNEIHFCYDYFEKDIEFSFVTEATCIDAGFMWSTDELKNLAISLNWEWDDFNNDGIDAANLEIFVDLPIENGESTYGGLYEFNYYLKIFNPGNNQPFSSYSRHVTIDLETNVLGIGELIEMNFPTGDLEYCVYVDIREQASTETVSLDGICEFLNVEDASNDDNSDEGDTYLNSNIIWNPYQDSEYGSLELFLHASVNIEGVSTVMVDYRVTRSNGGNIITGTTPLLSLNSENIVNYNLDFADFHSIVRYETWCIELELRDLEANIFDDKIGCLYLSDNVVDRSEVEWSSNLETGSTWVSSAIEGNEGHLAVDDNYDTFWESGESCQVDSQEIIINLPGYDSGNFHLVSGVSLEWINPPNIPLRYEILAWTSNNSW